MLSYSTNYMRKSNWFSNSIRITSMFFVFLIFFELISFELFKKQVAWSEASFDVIFRDIIPIRMIFFILIKILIYLYVIMMMIFDLLAIRWQSGSCWLTNGIKHFQDRIIPIKIWWHDESCFKCVYNIHSMTL